MASASGPMALEAALANFANSGLNMPELGVDEEDDGELDIRTTFQASQGAERKAAAGAQAARVPFKLSSSPPVVSNKVCFWFEYLPK